MPGHPHEVKEGPTERAWVLWSARLVKNAWRVRSRPPAPGVPYLRDSHQVRGKTQLDGGDLEMVLKKKKRAMRAALAFSVVLALSLSGFSSASAASTETTPVTSAAASYSYYAGHPLYFGGAGTLPACTGSYTIYGASGSFILTAGHCGAVGSTVFGTSSAFATVAHRKYPAPNGDSELLSYYSFVTPYQIIVDPVTGARPGPGGLGRVTGRMPNGAQTVGVLVGKMGITTGWTEGSITSTYNWRGVQAVVANYWSQGGDSGGPVWRHDGAGLRAVGMHVGSLYNSSDVRIGAVYIPINTLLTQWGASMGVFPLALASTGADLSVDDLPSSKTTLGPGESTALSTSLPDACPSDDCILVNE